MKIKEIIEQWKNESCGSMPSRAIVVHIHDSTIYIITDSPGLMIGWHGETINKYRKILEENGYNQQIEFIDTFVGKVKVF